MEISSGNLVQGNYLGVAAAGKTRLGNGRNRVSTDLGNFSNNNTIGGSTPEAGNVISANGNAGIFIGMGNGNLVLGNYIGTDASGTAALPNGDGIQIRVGSNNTIGGTITGARNIISGDSFVGV